MLIAAALEGGKKIVLGVWVNLRPTIAIGQKRGNTSEIVE
jgi:hypothetical protein